jgi:hypothetical protein
MANKVWIGGTSSSSSSTQSYAWANPAHWSPYGVPQAGDSITFSPNYNKSCTGSPGDNRKFPIVTVQPGFTAQIGSTKNPVQLNFDKFFVNRNSGNLTSNCSLIAVKQIGCLPAEVSDTYSPALLLPEVIVYDTYESISTNYTFSGNLSKLSFYVKDNKTNTNKTLVYNDKDGFIGNLVVNGGILENSPALDRYFCTVDVTADRIKEISSKSSIVNLKSSYITDIKFGSYDWSFNSSLKSPFTSKISIDGIPYFDNLTVSITDVNPNYSKECFVKNVTFNPLSRGQYSPTVPTGYNLDWLDSLVIKSGTKAIKTIYNDSKYGKINASSYGKSVGFRVGRYSVGTKPPLSNDSSFASVFSNSKTFANFVGNNNIGAIIY